MKSDNKPDNDLELLERVKSGEKIVCPICGKGTVIAYSQALACSEKNCRYQVRFYFRK